MIDHLFLAHPRQAGESYLAHLRTAACIGGTMLAGGLACLVHAVLPALCVRTGSDTIRRLHDRLSAHGGTSAGAAAGYDQGAWQPDYQI